jgi:hypothetical protein
MRRPADREARDRTSTMTILTPSYAPDFELCKDLIASVRRHRGAGVAHLVVVPPEDLDLFSELGGDGVEVQPTTEFLPRQFVRVRAANMWLNARRPYPPVRGWIAQQIVKLQAAASASTDVALLVDSDTVFVRDFSADDFMSSGRPSLYRLPDAIWDNLPGHRRWHHESHRLMGSAPPGPGLLPDYVGWPCAWEPAICRQLLDRVASVTRTAWYSAIGATLRFSEMILYGVFVDQVVDPDCTRIARTPKMLAVRHDAEVPLSRTELHELLATVGDEHVAVMVSAKSGTALDDRRAVLHGFVAPPRTAAARTRDAHETPDDPRPLQRRPGHAPGPGATT